VKGGSNHTNKSASDDAALTATVYAELRRLAHQYMGMERRNHTLQATELVHEALLRLAQVRIDYNDPVHFLSTVARQMRRILVDHARGRACGKRGGKLEIVALSRELALPAAAEPDFGRINQAIDELGEIDSRAQLALDLCYFASASQSHAAEVIGVSLATLERDLKFARAFVSRKINDG